MYLIVRALFYFKFGQLQIICLSSENCEWPLLLLLFNKEIVSVNKYDNQERLGKLQGLNATGVQF